MKKLLILLLTLLLVFALAACTPSQNPASDPASEGQSTATNVPEESEEPATEPEKKDDSNGAPVSLEGYWQDSVSGRASMYIEKIGDTYSVEITWGESTDTTVSWTMDCEYNQELGELIYENEKKVILSTSGADTSEEVAFENGTGLLKLLDGNIIWTDDQETTGQECIFELMQ